MCAPTSAVAFASKTRRHPLTWLAFAALATILTGCSGPRSSPLYDGATGERISWNELIDRALISDAVIVGEIHDDANGHAVQTALVVDLSERSSDLVLALEMMERDEQAAIDAWSNRLMSTEALVERTEADSWPDWWRNYQPSLDAARRAEVPIVAANAPREYVRLARIEGYEALEALPEAERRHFEMPETLDDGPYRERFMDYMLPGGPEAHDADRIARVEQGFKSQQVWDATMADSVADALFAGRGPVLLFIGQFHSDFDGGTILQLRKRRPDARILNVSLQQDTGKRFREEDRGRADVIVYTGPRD